MSDRDFAWYSSSDGRPAITARPVTASQSFRVGEPVEVVAAGTLSESTSDPASVTGIAAHRSTNQNGTDFGAGFLVTIYQTSSNQIFKTTSFTSDGAGATAAVPTAANVGDLAGLALTGGVWSLDTGTGNLICEITGVLDSNGRNLGDPNLLPGTGSIVLFRFIDT